ncbi:hypothetical protein [Streptomyces sp. NPDC047000]|uniref:hypothetical protein n=1 Tax=Streptomyces sp. NPDC047000 TaxID=3155474 RepID=UPI0033DE1A42
MSDTSTTQPLHAGSQDRDDSAGRHRGPVSAHEAEQTPRGRHRKPAEATEMAA